MLCAVHAKVWVRFQILVLVTFSSILVVDQFATWCHSVFCRQMVNMAHQVPFNKRIEYEKEWRRVGLDSPPPEENIDDEVLVGDQGEIAFLRPKAVEYEFERIVGTYGRGRHTKYGVKWTAYEECITWEPRSCLADDAVRRAYNQRRNEQRAKQRAKTQRDLKKRQAALFNEIADEERAKARVEKNLRSSKK